MTAHIEVRRSDEGEFAISLLVGACTLKKKLCWPDGGCSSTVLDDRPGTVVMSGRKIFGYSPPFEGEEFLL